jgi:hypothetical protein
MMFFSPVLRSVCTMMCNRFRLLGAMPRNRLMMAARTPVAERLTTVRRHHRGRHQGTQYAMLPFPATHPSKLSSHTHPGNPAGVKALPRRWDGIVLTRQSQQGTFSRASDYNVNHMEVRPLRPVRRTAARELPCRFAAFGLLCLQLVLSVLTVIADARPLAADAHPSQLTAAEAGTQPDSKVAAPHVCPFCVYLAAHQVAGTPAATAPLSSLEVPGSVVPARPEPPPASPLTSVHASRAPPAR